MAQTGGGAAAVSLISRLAWRDWLVLGLAGIAAAYLMYTLLPWLWLALGWRWYRF